MRIQTIQIIVILVLGFGFNLRAQTDDNYVQMRDEGMRLWRNYEFSAAYRMFDGASGFASSKKSKIELAALQKQLMDSVHITYERGVRMIEKSTTDADYLDAIQELKTLIPAEYFDVPLLYSCLGTAYERLQKNEDAIEQYSSGIKHKEALSALLLANLLQMHKEVTIDSLVGLYEFAAPRYNEAYDRLGDLFYSSSPQKAYGYYKDSQSNYGNYQMAKLLLEGNVSSNDNPVIMLKKLSDNDYAEAQFDLGILYYDGIKVTQDKSKGLRLIRLAMDNGSVGAMNWIKDREAKQYRENNKTSTRKKKHVSKIDWDVNDHTKGLAYNYSKHFPLAMSGNITISHFLIGGEFGFNLNNDKIYRSKIETETYSKIETDDPIVYVLLSPGMYFKYFSISFGVGSMLAKNQMISLSSSEISIETENGVSIEMHQSYQIEQKSKHGLILKPSLTSYFPIGYGGDSITLSVGYNYLPSFQELNGLTFGIGFQMRIK